MLRINCPVCGLRDESEFSYGGDATVVRPAHDETSIDVWHDYVFLRDNPRGPHREYWHHGFYCPSLVKRQMRSTEESRYRSPASPRKV